MAVGQDGLLHADGCQSRVLAMAESRLSAADEPFVVRQQRACFIRAFLTRQIPIRVQTGLLRETGATGSVD
jgi:hypothetical protein